MKKQKIKVTVINGAKFRAFLLEMASKVTDNDQINATQENDRAIFTLADTSVTIGRASK